MSIYRNLVILDGLLWRTRSAVLLLACVGIGSFAASETFAFVSNGRWAFTAGGGATGLVGAPTTLTWSLVPDGTVIPGSGTSDLLAFLDANFDGDGGDIQSKSWFADLIKPTFDRWTEISGMTFRYEENDDGATFGNFNGQVGVRGDVRVGGVFLDGPGGTDAQAGFIPNADITIDTGDPSFFSDPANDFRNLRNTLMHEIGHSLGLAHLDSTADFLLEPTYNSSIDGVQLDDIRGVQQLYGDRYERDEIGPRPNNSLDSATFLGQLSVGESLSVGMDAGASTIVTAEQSDFVSVANLNDVDYYTFDVETVGKIDVLLTPTGPNYFEKPSGPGAFSLTRSSQLSDLQFELYGPQVGGGTGLLTTADAASIGLPESLFDFPLTLPGEYSVKVLGSTNIVQLYQLSVSLSELDADFDSDGDTDGGDFLFWQRGLDVLFAEKDLEVWQTAYGAAPVSSAVITVPEPLAVDLAAFMLLGLGILRKAQS